MSKISEQLRSAFLGKAPLLLDGAMGTELERRGVPSRLPLWSARALIDSPRTVLAVHRENVEAGADVLTTNTFRTQRRTLQKEGMGDRAGELTALAVELARQAGTGAGREVYVLGALAPLEDCYRPDLAPPKAELEREHREQAQTLAQAGVDGLLVETQNSVVELSAAVAAAIETGLPVVASMVTDGQGRLLSGEDLGKGAAAIRSTRPDVLSINCVPARLLEGELRRLARVADATPLGAYGNLGPPTDPQGLHFDDQITPVEYAELARSWLDLGARLVGGCCGTTALHTAALRRLLDERRA
jgi:S-methylmethionine-dependent homocysteine/selenocysteine methylase